MGFFGDYNINHCCLLDRPEKINPAFFRFGKIRRQKNPSYNSNGSATVLLKYKGHK